MFFFKEKKLVVKKEAKVEQKVVDANEGALTKETGEEECTFCFLPAIHSGMCMDCLDHNLN
jgi:hypothetical protein